MKISIYALHLGIGGVEKYLISLANMLSDENDVTLISTYKVSSTPGFPVSDKVAVKYLLDRAPTHGNMTQLLKEFKVVKFSKLLVSNAVLFYKRYSSNKKCIQKDEADVIITSRIFHNNLVSKFAPTPAIKIATEHNYHNNDQKYINDLGNSLKNFNSLIPISALLTEFYSNEPAYSHLEIQHIRYFVDEQKRRTSLSNPNFIYIGRLSSEKGVDDLLRAFKLIIAILPSAKLNIVGDGSERGYLETLSNELDLSASVLFSGFLDSESISDLLVEQSFLLMTSHFESLGIVLLEAMSFGVIPIAFDSARGAVEVLDSFPELLIASRSGEAIAHVASSLFADPRKMKELSDSVLDESKLYTYAAMSDSWHKLVRGERLNEENS